MFQGIISFLSSVPAIYEFSQAVTGTPEVNKRIQKLIASISPSENILDIGGGTGSLKKMIPDRTEYVLCDIDEERLEFAAKCGIKKTILASAERLPIEDASFDIVISKQMSHHLSDEAIDSMFGEAHRILRPNGKFIFCDIVHPAPNMIGSWLWKHDVGSFPRSKKLLKEKISEKFLILNEDHYQLFHEFYISLSCPKKM